MANIKTTTFGSPSADAFDVLGITSIGMASGEFIDRIIINNVVHGGQGGAAVPTITLAAGEYVNEVSVIARPGSYVSYLKFTTNKGQTIEAGNISVNPTVLSNIKLLGIVGYSGWYIDQIEFIYDDLNA